MKRNLIINLISGLLILLFLYTGLSKLLEHEKFLYNLGKAPLLSSTSQFLAIALPVGEIILSGFLFFRRTQLKGLWISLGLLSLFTVYLVYMVSFYEHLPCSCGGVISKMSWKQHIFFNGFFVLLTVLAIRMEKKHRREGSNKEQSLPPIVFQSAC